MYNTKIICTYNTSDIFLETDDIDKLQKDFIRDAIYRQELLDILGMEDYNEDEMDKAIHELYEKVKDCSELKECMIKLCGHFMSIDEEFGLMLLFAYDYMYFTHICVSEFIETGKINEISIWNLKSIVF
jgi:hypothetical protein